MLPIQGWEVYYGDGSVFTNAMGTWTQAPGENVQALVLLHKAPYSTVFTGLDFYILPGRSTIKNGAWMPDDQWERMFQKVNGRLADWASQRA